MTLSILIEAMKSLAASKARDAASAARAMSFDLVKAEFVTSKKGYVAIHGAILPGLSKGLSLVFEPMQREWTMTGLEQLDIEVDRNQNFGRNQTRIASATGKGYAVLFEAPSLLTITASSDGDRLQTISVRLH